MNIKTFKHEAVIRSLKIFDIGYITSIYFLLGLACAKIIDSFYGKYDPKQEKVKPMFQRGIEIVSMMWISGIIIYIIKNIVEIIPSPIDGIYGFEHTRVKELHSASAFIFIFLYFQAHFKAKVQEFYNDFHLS